MCIYICVHVYIYIYVYVYIYIHRERERCIHIHVNLHVHICICISQSVHVSACAFTCVCLGLSCKHLSRGARTLIHRHTTRIWQRRMHHPEHTVRTMQHGSSRMLHFSVLRADARCFVWLAARQHVAVMISSESQFCIRSLRDVDKLHPSSVWASVWRTMISFLDQDAFLHHRFWWNFCLRACKGYDHASSQLVCARLRLHEQVSKRLLARCVSTNAAVIAIMICSANRVRGFTLISFLGCAFSSVVHASSATRTHAHTPPPHQNAHTRTHTYTNT